MQKFFIFALPICTDESSDQVAGIFQIISVEGVKMEYTEKDLVKIAKRENNTEKSPVSYNVPDSPRSFRLTEMLLNI